MSGRRGDYNHERAVPAALRVMDRVVVDEDGCWIWPGAQAGGGKAGKYGAVQVGSMRDGTRGIRSTHVVVWEWFEGPVPDGLELDHLCRARLCCNPGHLDPVPHRENVMRGAGVAAVNARRVECKHGHEFTPANTAVYQGKRSCRECRKRISREYGVRRRAARCAAKAAIAPALSPGQAA